MQLFCGLLFLKFRRDVVVSCWYGKLAICVFYLTVSTTILLPSAWGGSAILLSFLWIATLAVMLGALAGYVYRYAKVVYATKLSK